MRGKRLRTELLRKWTKPTIETLTRKKGNWLLPSDARENSMQKMHGFNDNLDWTCPELSWTRYDKTFTHIIFWNLFQDSRSQIQSMLLLYFEDIQLLGSSPEKTRRWRHWYSTITASLETHAMHDTMFPEEKPTELCNQWPKQLGKCWWLFKWANLRETRGKTSHRYPHKAMSNLPFFNKDSLESLTNKPIPRFISPRSKGGRAWSKARTKTSEKLWSTRRTIGTWRKILSTICEALLHSCNNGNVN